MARPEGLNIGKFPLAPHHLPNAYGIKMLKAVKARKVF
jgi:hypothetical protein